MIGTVSVFFVIICIFQNDWQRMRISGVRLTLMSTFPYDGNSMCFYD